MTDILFAIDISEKNYRKEWSGQGQTLKLLSWFKIWIMLYYLKWIREHREREIEQLISANSWYNTVLWLVSKSQTVLWLANWSAESADTADKILSSDWLVSLKLCSDWLLNLLQDEFHKWHRQTDRVIW